MSNGNTDSHDTSGRDGSATPYSTSHEEPIDQPGLQGNAIVWHDALDYDAAQFWEGIGEKAQAFVRLERNRRHASVESVHVFVEGRLGSEELLALYLALKQEEDK